MARWLRIVSMGYPCIEALQDRLGEINDLATAKIRLERKIVAADDAAAAAAWRRLLAHEEVLLERAQRKFWKWCTPAMLRELSHDFATVLGDPHMNWLGEPHASPTSTLPISAPLAEAPA